MSSPLLQDSDSSDRFQTVIALLRTFVKDSSSQSSRSEEKNQHREKEEEEMDELEKWTRNQMCLHINLPHLHHITTETWPEVLRVFLVMRISTGKITDEDEVKSIKDVVRALKAEPFQNQDITQNRSTSCSCDCMLRHVSCFQHDS